MVQKVDSGLFKKPFKALFGVRLSRAAFQKTPYVGAGAFSSRSGSAGFLLPLPRGSS